MKHFVKWIILALIHALLIFMINVYSIHFDVISEGRSTDMWFFSISMYTSIILVVDVKIAMSTQYWTWIYALTFLVTSIVPYIIFLVFVS